MYDLVGRLQVCGEQGEMKGGREVRTEVGTCK